MIVGIDDLTDLYNKDLDSNVLPYLNQLESFGSFYSQGSFSCSDSQLPMIGLDVKKVVNIDFSKTVTQEQIDKVLEKCVQAPHGKGTETVIDTSVRNVMQMDPKLLKLSNDKPILATLLPKISKDLGIPEKEKVKANLYKLLVYNKGSFFLNHKDTEKENNMFGTLVINLPSSHSGGDLIIRHSGQEAKVSMDGQIDNNTLKYCAFYADCEHEVKEITDGTRICLVYNLIKSGTSPLTVNISSIVKSQESINKIETGLIQNFRKGYETGKHTKLYVLLEHSYPPASFGPKKLKGRDLVLANLFNSIKERIACKVYLSILHITEEGVLYEDRARISDIPKDDLDDLKSECNFRVNCHEIFDLQGNVEKSTWEVHRVLGSLQGSKTTKRIITETTGNEGSMYEKLYHRASIILVPNNPYNPTLDTNIGSTSTLTSTSASAPVSVPVSASSSSISEPVSSSSISEPTTTSLPITNTTTTTTTNPSNNNQEDSDQPLKKQKTD